MEEVLLVVESDTHTRVCHADAHPLHGAFVVEQLPVVIAGATCMRSDCDAAVLVAELYNREHPSHTTMCI
jgi:hypothetical protein